MKIELPLSWFTQVARVDTPTICNALELASGRREATGFTYGTPIAAPKALPPIVGYARTLRTRSALPSTRSPGESSALRLSYYQYVSSDDKTPFIVVQEDLDFSPGIGSFWGEVNSAIHKGLGVQGVLTNGSVRDLDVLAEGFPIIAASVGPSHAHVHIVDFDQPVSVFGMQVKPDDLIHADRHGAVVIPAEFALELPRFIDLTIAKEKPILDIVKKPGFTIRDLELALKESAEIH